MAQRIITPLRLIPSGGRTPERSKSSGPPSAWRFRRPFTEPQVRGDDAPVLDGDVRVSNSFDTPSIIPYSIQALFTLSQDCPLPRDNPKEAGIRVLAHSANGAPAHQVRIAAPLRERVGVFLVAADLHRDLAFCMDEGMLESRLDGAHLRISIGPEIPGWGSWDWVGADVASEVSRWFSTSIFRSDQLPDGDLIFVVKHPLPEQIWKEIPGDVPIVYSPIDHYGSATAIDADGPWLRRCSRIVIHCERLRRYFAPYAPVEYIDHHVKFVAEAAGAYHPSGPLLWVGVRTNLPPLVKWLNRMSLPRELIVLTNSDDDDREWRQMVRALQRLPSITVDEWSPERHLKLLSQISGALDVKGPDFRSRHKPPAKAIDFIAAGIPLAMNADSSSVEHLARLGFDVADPEDPEWWLSREYWSETRRFGSALRELLSRDRIARRFRNIFESLLPEHVSADSRPVCSSVTL